VLMPHHGSASSSSPELLDALRPSIAIASAGYRSRFGHPAPATLARHAERGIVVESTAESGALAFRLAPDGSWRRLARRETRRRYWHERTVEPAPAH
jgi:competence protein ComEC